jgi:hypothetical protein
LPAAAARDRTSRCGATWWAREITSLSAARPDLERCVKMRTMAMTHAEGRLGHSDDVTMRSHTNRDVLAKSGAWTTTLGWSQKEPRGLMMAAFP